MKPDFLCIGAQKAATSWLYVQMKRHPKIWVPPIKELNYFNNTSSSLYKKLFSKHWLDKNWRVLIKQKLLQPTSRMKTDEIKYFPWYIKYFFFPRSFQWYISLFPDITGKIRGEFSVNYAVLGDKIISQISAKLPDLKIIYLLRNPITRTWSQAKMNLGLHKGNNLEDLSDEEFYKYFDHSYASPHSDYLANLKIFEKHFPTTHIFIGFFEEIQYNPISFLKKLFEFLELDFSKESYPDGLDRKWNVGLNKEIPVRYLTYLARKYHLKIRQIHQHFKNVYTKEWVNFTKQYIDKK